MAVAVHGQNDCGMPHDVLDRFDVYTRWSLPSSPCVPQCVEIEFLVQAVCGSLNGDPVVHQDQLGRHRSRLVLRHAGRRQVAGRQTHRFITSRKASPQADGEADQGRARQE